MDEFDAFFVLKIHFSIQKMIYSKLIWWFKNNTQLDKSNPGVDKSNTEVEKIYPKMDKRNPELDKSNIMVYVCVNM